MYLRWPVPDSFLSAPEVRYRNALFRHLFTLPEDEIAAHCTNMTVEGMRTLVRIALREAGLHTLSGIGLEAGAGCGLQSAVIAELHGAIKIYALEACEEACRLVIPKMAAHVLGSKRTVVQPVFGTFDNLLLPDGALDFVVELHAYHHARDLAGAVREAARVLTPGGHLICFDRCHADSLADDEVERMLAITYSREFLRANYYPEDAVLTRAENGEHEYRLFEWQAAFDSADLHMVCHVDLERTVKKLSSHPPASRTAQRSAPAPRDTTLFVLRKPLPAMRS